MTRLLDADQQRVRRLELRLRCSGVAIALGLAIEWISLRQTTPVTFVVFAIAMGVCFPLGALLFLSTLFGNSPSARS